MNDDDLRSLGPPGLSSQRHEALRGALLDEIAASDAAAAELPDHQRAGAGFGRARWLRIAAAAVVTMALAATAALALTSNDGDPTEVATVAEGDVLGPGPLPGGLAADRLTCVTSVQADGEGVQVDAQAAPGAQDLTPEDLVASCRALQDNTENNTARVVPFDEPCREPGEAVPTAISIGVVPCEARGLAPLTSADLDALNDARRVEALLAALDIECPSYDEVAAWVREQLEVTGAALTLRTSDVTPADGCFEPVLSWSTSTVTIEATA